MKTLMLLSCFLLLHAPLLINDLARQKLKGRVKSVTSCQCPVKQDGTIDSGWCTIYAFTYDEQGNQVEDKEYVGISLASGQSKKTSRHVYMYDEQGRQAEVYEYVANGSLKQVVRYEYDSNGNRTARYNYKPGGILWYRSVFSYDELGHKTGCDKYNADSLLLEQYAYKYDDKGNLAKEQYYVTGQPGKHGDNRLDDSSGIAVKKLVHIKTYTHDERGDMLTEKYLRPNVSSPFVTEYIYLTYDKEGNWLKQTIIDNGRPANVTERVIEYY